MPVMFLALSYRTAFIFSMYSMTEYGIPRTLARAVLTTLPEEVIECTAIKQLLPLNQFEGLLSWGLIIDGRHHLRKLYNMRYWVAVRLLQGKRCISTACNDVRRAMQHRIVR